MLKFKVERKFSQRQILLKKAKSQKNLERRRVIPSIEEKSQKHNNIFWTEENQKVICLLKWTKVKSWTVVVISVILAVVNLSLLQGKTPDDT